MNSESKAVMEWFLKNNYALPLSSMAKDELARLIEIVYNLGAHKMILNENIVNYLMSLEKING